MEPEVFRYNNNYKFTLSQRRQDSGKICDREGTSPMFRRLSNGNVWLPVPECSQNSSRESRKARGKEPCGHQGGRRKCSGAICGKRHGEDPGIQAQREQTGGEHPLGRLAGEPPRRILSPFPDTVCLRSISGVQTLGTDHKREDWQIGNGPSGSLSKHKHHILAT